MKQSEHINELAKALAKAQSEFPQIPKTKTARVPTKSGGEYTYRYADLADIIAITTPILSSNGISIVQGTDTLDKDTALLETTIIHSSGQYMQSSFPVKLYTRPQETGSELTYMRRYTLTAALGIHGDEDEDGKGASDHGEVAGAASDRKPIIKSVTHVGPSITQSKAVVVPKINGEHINEKTVSPFGSAPIIHAQSGTQAPKKATDKQLKFIFARFKNLNFEEDQMRSFIFEATGKESTTDFDYSDVNKVILKIDELENKNNRGNSGNENR